MDERDTRKILVLDRRGTLSSDLARAANTLDMDAEILRLRRPTQVDAVTEEMEPDVVIASPEEMTQAGLRRLARIHRAHPRSVIVLCPNGRPVTVREAAACGASDVLPYPSTQARMRTKLRRALEVADELRAERVVVRETVREAPAPKPTHEAHVFTITSASGGCGKTFYATNFASYLAHATGGKVLLLDLDLQFGEVAVSLRIRSDRTIAELIEEDDVAAAFGEYTVHHDAGFDVLCAPKDPVAAERVGPREATEIIAAARGLYDHVVVDTPPALNEVVLAAFDQSSSLVVMATLDVPSLRNLRVFLETIDRLKVPADDIALVLNKAEDGTGIDISKLERVYPQGFSAVLPYAPEVTRSLNAGQPVIATDPRAEISRKLIDGAKAFVAPSEGVVLPWGAAAAKRRGLISRLLRKGAES